NQESSHGNTPVAGLRYNENAIAPGAQTVRPGDAGPVRALLGGENAPAAFVFVAAPLRVRKPQAEPAATEVVGRPERCSEGDPRSWRQSSSSKSNGFNPLGSAGGIRLAKLSRVARESSRLVLTNVTRSAN